MSHPVSQPGTPTTTVPSTPGAAPSAVVVRPEGKFRFDGGAGSFFLVGLGAALLNAITLGLALPWAMCMYFRWQTEHTIIDGRRLRFTGSGGGLFGQYLKWWLLTIVTFGLYAFWVWPRMVRWCTERQDFGRQA